jgi:hypothetical protein
VPSGYVVHPTHWQPIITPSHSLMKNPFIQFKYAFEFWAAAVFGIYSQDFCDWNEWLFRCPEYTQENLTGRFWDEINDGWDWMQPYMIDHLAEFRAWDKLTPQ